jgi:hypothetical protein
MPEPIKERITTDLQKVKTEGGTRISKIQEIVKTAASEVTTEVQQGAGEVRTIAKDTLSTVFQTFNDQGHTEGETESISSTTRLSTFLNQLKDQLVIKLRTLDTNLESRYGDRYINLKQRWDRFAAWYNAARANSEMPVSNAVEHKQAELEQKVGEAGASIARKEQQIRQQIKIFLQTATTKS